MTRARGSGSSLHEDSAQRDADLAPNPGVGDTVGGVHPGSRNTGEVERINESVGRVGAGKRVGEPSAVVSHDGQPVSPHGSVESAHGFVIGILESRLAQRDQEAPPSPEISPIERTGATWQEEADGPARSEHAGHLGETVIEGVEQHEGHRAGNSPERVIVALQVMGLADDGGLTTAGTSQIEFGWRSIDADPRTCPSRPEQGCTAASEVKEVGVLRDHLQQPLVRVLSR